MLDILSPRQWVFAFTCFCLALGLLWALRRVIRVAKLFAARYGSIFHNLVSHEDRIRSLSIRIGVLENKPKQITEDISGSRPVFHVPPPLELTPNQPGDDWEDASIETQARPEAS